MKIKILIPVGLVFVCFLIAIFATCVNVQIQNAKPKVIVRGLVTRTIHLKDKALAYLEKLYTSHKDLNDPSDSVASQGTTWWFVHFYQSVSTVTSNGNSIVEAVPVGIEGVQ